MQDQENFQIYSTQVVENHKIKKEDKKQDPNSAKTKIFQTSIQSV